MHASFFSNAFLVSLSVYCCHASSVGTKRANQIGRRSFNAIPFSPGYPVQTVVDLALNISTHSWEFGTLTEALLELYDPDIAVFGDAPFDAATDIDPANMPRGLSYAEAKIV